MKEKSHDGGHTDIVKIELDSEFIIRIIHNLEALTMIMLPDYMLVGVKLIAALLQVASLRKTLIIMEMTSMTKLWRAVRLALIFVPQL